MWGGGLGEGVAVQGLWSLPWCVGQCLHLSAALPANRETSIPQQSSKGKRNVHWKICLAHKVTVVLFFLPQFAEWCLTSSERQTNTPDRPFSLFEGMELNCLPPTCPSIIESSTPTPPLLNYPPPTPPLQNMFVSLSLPVILPMPLGLAGTTYMYVDLLSGVQESHFPALELPVVKNPVNLTSAST